MPSFVDGDLPAEEQEIVGLHVRRCFICSEEVTQLKQVLAACGEALDCPDPTGGYQELRQRLRTLEISRNIPSGISGISTIRLIGHAAAFAAVMVLFAVCLSAIDLLQPVAPSLDADAAFFVVEQKDVPAAMFRNNLAWRSYSPLAGGVGGKQGGAS